MPRYIDANKIDYKMETIYTGINMAGNSTFQQRAIAYGCDIDEMPTEDVVPRSEVVRLQIDKENLEQSEKYWKDKCKRHEMYCDELMKKLEQAEQEVAREILNVFASFRALSPNFCKVFEEKLKEYGL